MRKILTLTGLVAGALAWAPPTAAQDCKAGPYVVFFEYDRDAINPAAAAILDKAAEAYRGCDGAELTISGHTDRKASDEYNVGLSQRMASNVRSYLAGRGVPDGVMTTQAFGESRPAVATADGKAEPRNRRVEVTFGPGSGW